MSVHIYSANVPRVRRLTDASLQMRLSAADGLRKTKSQIALEDLPA